MFVLFMIDGGSFVDDSDPKWDVYFVYVGMINASNNNNHSEAPQ